MTTTGIDLAITLALNLLDRAAAYGALITQSRAEGRDISDAELDALAAEDDVARKELEAAIAKRRQG
jgi:hypothetical protein